MNSISPSTTPRLAMQGIGKQYGVNWVLRDVELTLYPGQVLALLGENGAGKSTLVKILSGAVHPDTGNVVLDGEDLAGGDPALARRRGVAIVYQELSVCPDLSIEANVLLGVERHCGSWLLPKEQRPRIREVFQLLGYDRLDLHQPVGTLSIGMQQLVEIARALLNDARVLVLDEPTSSLPAADAQRLFVAVRRAAAAGLSVIYISHFMEEIRQLCDSYLVLRDGRVAGKGQLGKASARESLPSDRSPTHDDRSIVRLMVGRDVADLYPSVPHAIGDPILTLHGIRGERLPGPLDLTVRQGEIVGIAGLVGAGRTELLRLLLGLDPTQGGELKLHGRPVRGATRERVRLGLGLVSENRKTEGLALQRSIVDNITLSRMAPYHRLGWLKEGQRRWAAQAFMTRLRVKAEDADDPVDRLSGGNQQKVALARMLHQQADVWLLDEPTRGIDVGTKAEIYQLIGELAARGTTILLVSSYFPELLQLCDRIAVLARGRLVDLRPAADWNEHELMLAAMGSDQGPTSPAATDGNRLPVDHPARLNHA